MSIYYKLKLDRHDRLAALYRRAYWLWRGADSSRPAVAYYRALARVLNWISPSALCACGSCLNYFYYLDLEDHQEDGKDMLLCPSCARAHRISGSDDGCCKHCPEDC